ncbi:MAG: MarR family winged helix-turn-helix transcriptional regulator [Methyloceanibacter sp.]
MLTEREIIDSCACLRARTAARVVTRAYDDALRPVGLRATQLSVLVAVAAEGAMSITALAKFMGMDRSTLTRNLRPVEKEGLVALGAEGWHRSRNLEITKLGRARLREALPLWSKAQQSLRKKLGERGWDDVRTSLDRLIQTA